MVSLNLQITMNIFKFWIHLENQPPDSIIIVSSSLHYTNYDFKFPEQWGKILCIFGHFGRNYCKGNSTLSNKFDTLVSFSASAAVQLDKRIFFRYPLEGFRCL